MANITVKQIAALSKVKGTRKSIGGGLYFIVPKSGEPYWALRFTAAKKRKQMTLGSYADLTLADAKVEAEIQKKGLRQGLDPLVAKQRKKQTSIQTIEQLFNDWFENDLSKRLKYPNIPQRVFTNDIKPVLGAMRIEEVNARDIRVVLSNIAASNRPTIANDTLMYMKQLFRHAIKLDLTANNPASAFTVSDAGGIEKSRDRILSLDEFKQVFLVFRENITSFGRDNYLAVALISVLGVRKGELCRAMWQEFDLIKGVWNLPEGRSKTGAAISIPLPTQAIAWLNELKIRAFGSDYVLPSRRRSKNPHIGDDTLNRAISKLFGIEQGRKVQPPNKMGSIKYFTVHDLRRTFRSVAASLGVPGHVGERCLNHKLKGIEGIYDRYDYFDERKQAHQLVADKLQPMIDV